jgi:hypothetical protein
MPKPPLLVKIEVGRGASAFRASMSLSVREVFFARNVQLLAGTRVMIRFSRGRDEVSLPGTLCAHYGDLGLSVEFREDSASRWKDSALCELPRDGSDTRVFSVSDWRGVLGAIRREGLHVRKFGFTMFEKSPVRSCRSAQRG